MSCYLGKEQCVCNIISYMIEMNCNQYANSYKIFNLSQLQHNYSYEKKIKLTIENKNNLEIISSKSQMILSIVALTIRNNRITEIIKNSFKRMDNLKILFK